MDFNVKAFLDSLPIMGKGMLGIFVVATVIIISVLLLEKLTSGKESE